jgi:putative ABC transport system ATP-binding protein
MLKKILVSIRHLSVTYFPGKSNEVQALKDISLEINEGEFIIFFGPSGCGKSTLLYSIAGLERNIEGDVIIQEKNIAHISEKGLEHFHQSTVGMIFQSFYLIASLSVRRNVLLPRIILGSGIRERERKATKLLEHFGVLRQANKLPTELSGGQQQRVSICRSLMNDPVILMADEPVGNLDSKSADDVMTLLRKLNDKEKKTILLVTHDPSHLHHAHRIYYLNDGKITAVKENSEEERQRSFLSSAQHHIGAGLEHWMRTLHPENTQSNVNMQSIWKTHELLTEFFTGFTAAEMARLEAEVQHYLASDSRSTHALCTVLRRPAEHGGFSMHPRKAERLTGAIQQKMREIRSLHAMEKSKVTGTIRQWAQAQAIRRFVFDEIDMTMRASKQRLAIDKAIYDRLGRGGSFRKFLDALDMPAPGGPNLDRRIARKFARRAEALINAGIPGGAQIPVDEDDISLAVLDSTNVCECPPQPLKERKNSPSASHPKLQ